MQEYRCKQEDFHFSDLIPDAPPLAHGEDHDAPGQVFVEAAVFIQEPRWVENVGVLPLLEVVVDGPLVDEHDGVLGDVETLECDVRGGGVGDGDGHEAGVTHGLIDEGLGFRNKHS